MMADVFVAAGTVMNRAPFKLSPHEQLPNGRGANVKPYAARGNMSQ